MSNKTKPPTYSDLTITVSQILLYIFVAFPLRLCYRAKRTLPKNIKLLRSGSLMVANHQSFADGFYVILALPFRTYLSMLPLRFPVADWVLRNPFFNPPFFRLLKFLGCFSIGITSTEKMKGIFYIRSLLKNKKSVVLFPEGSITSDKNVKELKEGLDFFKKHAINMTFVRLRGFNVRKGGESKCSITYGEVFEPPPKMSLVQMGEYLNSL
ncbi:1-acyl-sn-glycerol-3-phosphate acyltransferase [Candidatus Nomurabacteria bacterium]|nr:1-acyl-sn-glycerol-3-phosphate acyltransferase [Candidatus Kaiserbacteria bacterium]MCB9815231.1 1-acyl-sn-glycerol-3-phosphate acyltransferase [Candidatus Nomurabacteria bacterium]